MKRKKEQKENSERWLLTYSDMITLLLVLFILLYAMSSVDQDKYESLATSLSQSMGSGGINSGTSSILSGSTGLLTGGVTQEGEGDGTGSDGTEDGSGSGDSQSEDETSTAVETLASMEEVKNTIESIISSNNLGTDIGINITSVGLIISFPSTVYFDSGSAEISDTMKSALDKIAPELNSLTNDVTVKAYTDSTPIKNSTYSSNWQLSSARASNVVQYLQNYGQVDKERLSAIGCADNNPVDTNDTEEGRSRNRRIEINILYTSSSTNTY